MRLALTVLYALGVMRLAFLVLYALSVMHLTFPFNPVNEFLAQAF